MRANTDWLIEDYGEWTGTLGLRKSKVTQRSIATRRKNFNGEPIITAMVILDNKTISDPYDLR